MNDPDLIQINNQLWMLRLVFGIGLGIFGGGVCWLGLCLLRLAAAIETVGKTTEVSDGGNT